MCVVKADRLSRSSTHHVGMARLVATAVAVSCHVASAFSGHAIILIQKDGFRLNRCWQLHSNRRPELILRQRRQRHLEHWGIERRASPPFPSTFGAVADAASRAIAGTFLGLQRPDPNEAGNAMHQSVLDYRPTHPRWASRRRWMDGDDDAMTSSGKRKDVPARMSMEIDGAAYLADPCESGDEGRAMRVLSLHIAQRLTFPWEGAESSDRRRSVAVYFNSVEHSLLASRELSRWKDRGEKSLDHITIHCLGQDSVPSGMVQKRESKHSKSNEQESIILIVKPTDYDADRNPVAAERQPAIQANVIDKLQALLFQASASSIPAVVLSPRLSELSPLQSMSDYIRTGPSGFEQSGYQQSSTFGGIEPPVGPTSWLLRDLTPPVYVWVGCANMIGQRKRSRRSVALSYRPQPRNASSAEAQYFSRVALTQSAMEAGHHWHMFAVQERSTPSVSALRTPEAAERQISYHYIGSSSASRGRPSSRIMKDVLEEFCSN